MTNHDELPTVDELLAYRRGDLAPQDEARVREALVRNPDLARALVTPFPEDDAQPGDASYLSEAEIAKQWKTFNQEPAAAAVTTMPVRSLNFWRLSTALAASLAVVLGIVAIRDRAQMAQPRVAAEEKLLMPDGQRGPGEASAVLSADGESYLLITPLIDQPAFDDYRLEIDDVVASPPRSLWRSGPLRRGENDTFAVLVPHAFLRPGRYQVVLYGVRAGRDEKLATYTVRVR